MLDVVLYGALVWNVSGAFKTVFMDGYMERKIMHSFYVFLYFCFRSGFDFLTLELILMIFIYSSLFIALYVV